MSIRFSSIAQLLDLAVADGCPPEEFDFLSTEEALTAADLPVRRANVPWAPTHLLTAGLRSEAT